MERLNDHSLLTVFKLVNLNDRASLRLVNKRFKTLCDSVPINKLIVFERRPVVRKLPHTEDHSSTVQYNYEHTAQCFDLQMFFTNKTLLNQMQPLRVLVIYGDRLHQTKLDLNMKFDQLNYLLLHHLHLYRPKVLESSQIEYLVLEQVYMKDNTDIEKMMRDLNEMDESFITFSIQAFGFDSLRSKGLKYLRLKPIKPLELEFFECCVQHKLFDSLEELEVTIDDFKSLLLLSERCPNIKVIDAITPSCYEVFDLIATTDLPDFFRRIRKDLQVYLFGIEFNERTVDEMQEFLFKCEQTNLNVQCSNLRCTIDVWLYKEIKQFEKQHNLTRFYRLVTDLTFLDLIEDPKFCKRFVNAVIIRFALTVKPPADFANYYDYFPSKKSVCVATQGLQKIQFSDAFYDEIPKRCPHLFAVALDCTNDALQFDFLFQLEQLDTILLNLAFPFDQSVYIELIRRLKHLFRLDFRWVGASVDRDQLGSFKKQVLACLAEKRSSEDLEFKINIHSKGSNWFVRYHLYPKMAPSIVRDEEMLYAWSAEHLN